MFSKEDAEKIDSYLHKNFDIIFDFEFNGLMLLFGGAVKDLIMGEPINDLDLILLTQEIPNFECFLAENGIRCKPNKYGGCNFIYNGIKIDMSYTDDLYYAGCLSTDFLFYDIKNKQFIPVGAVNAIKNNTIMDYYYNGYYKSKKRIKKAKKFINFMNNNNKKIRIKYKYNRFLRLGIGAAKKILSVFSKEKKYVK